MKRQIAFLASSLILLSSCRNNDNEFTNIRDDNSITEKSNSKLFDKNKQALIGTKMIKRYYSNKTKKHFYGVNVTPPGFNPNTQEWVSEGNIGYLNDSYFPGYSIVSLYKNGDNLITKDITEINNAQNNGYVVLEVLGYSSPSASLPVYRYFVTSSGVHFYTNNYYELGNGGGIYNYEGVAFYTE